MMAPKDPFEEFREKKKLEKLHAKAKGDSGPMQAPSSSDKKTPDSPVFDKNRSWFY